MCCVFTAIEHLRSCDVSYLCSGDTWFKSRPSHRIYLDSSWFPSAPPCKFQDIVSIRATATSNSLCTVIIPFDTIFSEVLTLSFNKQQYLPVYVTPWKKIPSVKSTDDQLVKKQTVLYRDHNLLHDPPVSQFKPVHILPSCLRLIFSFVLGSFYGTSRFVAEFTRACHSTQP